MNITPLLKTAKFFIMKNSPAILTAIGAVGVVTTTVTAIRATPAANAALEKDLDENGPCTTNLEVVQRYVGVTWRYYVPAVLIGAGTITAIIGAHSINQKRLFAIAGAYSLLEQTAKEYEDKVLDVVGEKKHAEIQNARVEDRLERDWTTKESIIQTGSGSTLCYDMLTGRYFFSDLEKIRQAQNTMNQRLINSTWVSLNELYSEIGLETVKLGEDIGWVPDNLIDLKFMSKLTPTGDPCLVLDYYVDPKLDYYQSIPR